MPTSYSKKLRSFRLPRQAPRYCVYLAFAWRRSIFPVYRRADARKGFQRTRQAHCRYLTRCHAAEQAPIWRFSRFASKSAFAWHTTSKGTENRRSLISGRSHTRLLMLHKSPCTFLTLPKHLQTIEITERYPSHF